MSQEHTVEVKIIVNTIEKIWSKKTISYEEVVILANGLLPDLEAQAPVVTYTRGQNDNPKGTLSPDSRPVKVKEGMVFNVRPSGRS